MLEWRLETLRKEVYEKIVQMVEAWYHDAEKWVGGEMLQDLSWIGGRSPEPKRQS